MRNWINKYRSLSGTIILAGYLFLNLSNIFHHHKFILGGEFTIDADQSSGLIQNNPLGLGCSVHQNFHSVNTLIFPISSFNFQPNHESNQKLVLNSNNFHSDNFYSANHLRAPPEIF